MTYITTHTFKNYHVSFVLLGMSHLYQHIKWALCTECAMLHRRVPTVAENRRARHSRVGLLCFYSRAPCSATGLGGWSVLFHPFASGVSQASRADDLTRSRQLFGWFPIVLWRRRGGPRPPEPGSQRRRAALFNRHINNGLLHSVDKLL